MSLTIQKLAAGPVPRGIVFRQYQTAAAAILATTKHGISDRAGELCNQESDSPHQGVTYPRQPSLGRLRSAPGGSSYALPTR